jgi:hypothetical protein
VKNIYLAFLCASFFCLSVQVVESRPYNREKDWPQTCAEQEEKETDCNCNQYYYYQRAPLPGDGDFGEETSWPTNFEDSFYDSLTR